MLFPLVLAGLVCTAWPRYQTPEFVKRAQAWRVGGTADGNKGLALPDSYCEAYRSIDRSANNVGKLTPIPRDVAVKLVTTRWILIIGDSASRILCVLPATPALAGASTGRYTCSAETAYDRCLRA